MTVDFYEQKSPRYCFSCFTYFSAKRFSERTKCNNCMYNSYLKMVPYLSKKPDYIGTLTYDEFVEGLN